MAANYWVSTQYLHWQYSKEELARLRRQLEHDEKQLHQPFPLPEQRLLNVFFNQQLAKLGKRLTLRQQALATAQVYLKRFYTKVEIRRTNPYLVIATALYLACKVEECPQHIRMIISESRQLWPAVFMAVDVAKLGECEFALISEMHSQMIVHHPYRALRQIQDDLALGPEDFSLAWSVVNDHYLTDLPLLYAPHVIAVAAIFLAFSGRRMGPASGISGPGRVNGAANGHPSRSRSSSNGNGNTSTSPLVPPFPRPGGTSSTIHQTALPNSSASRINLQTKGTSTNSTAMTKPSPTSTAQSTSVSLPPPPLPPFATTSFSATTQSAAAPASLASDEKAQQLVKWLAEQDIDIDAVVQCTQEIISLYAVMDQWNEAACKDQIARFIRARGLDK